MNIFKIRLMNIIKIMQYHKHKSIFNIIMYSVRKWIILDRDFSMNTGELTPTLKLKRNAITKSFENEINKIYS